MLLCGAQYKIAGEFNRVWKVKMFNYGIGSRAAALQLEGYRFRSLAPIGNS
jgi:hypothetical protein